MNVLKWLPISVSLLLSVTVGSWAVVVKVFATAGRVGQTGFVHCSALLDKGMWLNLLNISDVEGNQYVSVMGARPRIYKPYVITRHTYQVISPGHDNNHTLTMTIHHLKMTDCQYFHCVADYGNRNTRRTSVERTVLPIKVPLRPPKRTSIRPPVLLDPCPPRCPCVIDLGKRVEVTVTANLSIGGSARLSWNIWRGQKMERLAASDKRLLTEAGTVNLGTCTKAVESSLSFKVTAKDQNFSIDTILLDPDYRKSPKEGCPGGNDPFCLKTSHVLVRTPVKDEDLILMRTPEGKIVAGMSVTFICLVRSLPSTPISWEFQPGAGEWESRRLLGWGREYVITHVKSGNSGIYICKTFNKVQGILHKAATSMLVFVHNADDKNDSSFLASDKQSSIGDRKFAHGIGNKWLTILQVVLSVVLVCLLIYATIKQNLSGQTDPVHQSTNQSNARAVKTSGKHDKERT